MHSSSYIQNNFLWILKPDIFIYFVIQLSAVSISRKVRKYPTIRTLIKIYVHTLRTYIRIRFSVNCNWALKFGVWFHYLNDLQFTQTIYRRIFTHITHTCELMRKFHEYELNINSNRVIFKKSKIVRRHACC